MKSEPATSVVTLLRENRVPTDYKPEEGLKRVAVAEAMENYYARAKDATKLREAMEAKLGEQRRYILWFDGTFHPDGTIKGGDYTSDKANNRPVISLPDHHPDPMTRTRWRQKLKDPKTFDAALEGVSIRAVRLAEFQKGATEQKGASGTGENEWYTPDDWLALAREVLGSIDLDPASSLAAQEKVKAAKFFTREDDGLSQNWHGRVWLNPPYAQPWIADFTSKMCSEYRESRVSEAIMLTHNYTDTAWFQEAAATCSAICFPRGRVKFYDATGKIAAPTQGQAFIYFGKRAEVFAEVFRDRGFVAEPFTGVIDG